MSSDPHESQFETAAVDLLLSALSSECSRCVVNYFSESSGDVASVDELAEYVADRRIESDRYDVDRIATRLHHASLPKLADAGVVEYDPQATTVRYRPRLAVAQELLGRLPGQDEAA
ncbi:DUF7344 domain-containing protein [Halomicrococcus gelatinilyticus]|uniref:DUF7344 domain-containing protein n=1 Tax=Halomicrococcus gelatinilyticus TaxID=1702103 RepID=UPI002E10B49F